VFSSIEKLKNQVNRGQLRWGPCHTTKFWQENCVLFDIQENLHLIDTIVNKCLTSHDDRVKAVACFDLGEFARYYHHGREFLDTLRVKEKIARLMMDKNVSAEVKKEAITCYQKLLMNSWSGNDIK
jgi:V-type H+-transporting ATPase subunit H